MPPRFAEAKVKAGKYYPVVELGKMISQTRCGLKYVFWTREAGAPYHLVSPVSYFRDVPIALDLENLCYCCSEEYTICEITRPRTFSGVLVNYP